VVEGQEKIQTAEVRYHVVILDFKLPWDLLALQPEVDESLCHWVRGKMPDAIVVHVTAYGEDPRGQQHMKRYHNIDDPRGSFFPKDQADWIERLGASLKTHLYGKQIKTQLDDLFGRENGPATPSYGHARRSGAASPNDTTWLLSRVCQDIIEHWADIDEHLKHRVRGIFRVEEKPGQPIRIGLL
jgi:hypothetical protein